MYGSDRFIDCTLAFRFMTVRFILKDRRKDLSRGI